jgi:ABC-type iron transport system FetAB ATPase subunit
MHAPLPDHTTSHHLLGKIALQASGLASAYAGPFSLCVESGECLVVRGPSGVGKSLLLRMISDLDENTGTVALFGQNRNDIRAPDWRRQVLYQAAEPAWWEATAEDHFPRDQQEQVRALLPLLGLQENHLTIDVMRMSTGERQRMALIRSLAMNPKVLLLDEPTASLDSESTLAVEALLKEQLTSGLALILVTHSAQQADRMGHRQMLLTRTPKP